MIPSRFEPVVFVFILSGLMSFVVSGISTWRAVGAVANFIALWGSGWLSAWLIAFPIALAVAPLARRWAGRLVQRG